MSITAEIADKLKTIGKNEQKVFDAGKKAGYEHFWDVMQQSGQRVNYQRAFCGGSSWNDETYNPKYPIKHHTTTAPTDMYGYNGSITDTKVPISIKCTNISYMFRSASALKTIRQIELLCDITDAGGAFTCKSLENIIFTGTGRICADVNFSVCTKLTHDSLLSIINALSDSSAHTLTIGSVNKAKLTAAELAVATDKGWTVL